MSDLHRRIFKFIETADASTTVNVFVNGQKTSAYIGDTVAGLLFNLNKRNLKRSINFQSARGYYCGMGICWECTVTIDGQVGIRACLTEVKEGMDIVTNAGSFDDV